VKSKVQICKQEFSLRICCRVLFTRMTAVCSQIRQTFILMVVSRHNTAAFGERNSHMKYMSRCETPRELIRGVANCVIMLWVLYFVLKILSQWTFTFVFLSTIIYLCHWPRRKLCKFVSTRRHSIQIRPWATKCLQRQIS